jgi:hypothetical protein
MARVTITPKKPGTRDILDRIKDALRRAQAEAHGWGGREHADAGSWETCKAPGCVDVVDILVRIELAEAHRDLLAMQDWQRA